MELKVDFGQGVSIRKCINKDTKKSNWEDGPKKKVLKTKNANPVPDGWRSPKY